MCTVSIVPTRTGVRLISNRDERRTRPAAVPPRVQTIGERRAVFPVDPAGGGTWVGANDAGLVLSLLNRCGAEAPESARHALCSRGDIIPRLLAHDRLVRAVDAALALVPAQFDLFRLVVLQGWAVAVVSSDGCRLTSTFLHANQPVVWTSSSLGDAVVERPRGALFDGLVRDAPRDEWRQRQNRFHRHRWKRHPEISVVMSRSDADTVSRTIVAIEDERIIMSYQPLGDARIVVERQLERVA